MNADKQQPSKAGFRLQGGRCQRLAPGDIHYYLTKMTLFGYVRKRLKSLVECKFAIHHRSVILCSSMKRFMSSKYWREPMLPCAFAEEALGDLEEQYELHRYADGQEKALHWYRRQVRLELANAIWRSVERLAAVCGILEVARALFRK